MCMGHIHVYVLEVDTECHSRLLSTLLTKRGSLPEPRDCIFV